MTTRKPSLEVAPITLAQETRQATKHTSRNTHPYPLKELFIM